MKDDSYLDCQREDMVLYQIAARGIKDACVLEAMRSVPRHAFIPPEYQYAAYADGPLPIGLGQTISQPYIVALMTELLELKGGEKVLEVGTGSGYQAAILTELAKEVHTIERYPELARKAEQNLKNAGFENVQIHIGDGSRGLLEHAPYDGIIVTAAAPAAPQPLLDQLKDGGRLVIPVGGRGEQYLERWQRKGDEFESQNILPVAFVPLIGDEGWREY
jgi:protein-L-isoaspartate(D-aspartate) O-methyltransferase